MVMQIPVSGGKFIATVDDDDYEFLSQSNWCAMYPQNHPEKRYAHRRNGKEGLILMHRVIMGLGKGGMVVDHINGDTLDNRKENLRVCTRSENMRNYKVAYGNIPARGIIKTRGGHYRSRIRLNGVSYDIGTFDTLHDASVAYRFASKVFHGEFGSLPGHDLYLKDHVTKEE